MRHIAIKPASQHHRLRGGRTDNSQQELSPAKNDGTTSQEAFSSQ